MNKCIKKYPTEISNLKEEKRVWISPKLDVWENKNIENEKGTGFDAGTKAHIN